MSQTKSRKGCKAYSTKLARFKHRCDAEKKINAGMIATL